MKKFYLFLLPTILLMLFLPFVGITEADVALVDSNTVINAPAPEIPLTAGYDWTALASVAGATAFTLLVVQFIKAPLDRIWHIPTRVVVYIIAFATLLVAQVFTVGFSPDALVLTAVNAVIVSSAAMGAYELTFAKVEKPDAD